MRYKLFPAFNPLSVILRTPTAKIFDSSHAYIRIKLYLHPNEHTYPYTTDE